MSDSGLDFQDFEDCVPDAPDVQAMLDKGIATAKGKIASLDFRPVDFNIDIGKFFDFNMFGKLLGRDGLGMDVCDHCINGTDFVDMDGGAFMPAQDTIDGLNQSINDNAQGIADNAQGIADNANQGGGTP